MNILVIGDQTNFQECQQKFGGQPTYSLAKQFDGVIHQLTSDDFVFDFCVGDDVNSFAEYNACQATVFFNNCKVSLAAMMQKMKATAPRSFFGFNGMPTFLNRDALEVSLPADGDVKELAVCCAVLNTNYLIVDDRVGLVAPRVVCMIINEAYYALQEGTASREDIDRAMLLGTNYPYGPFEWCNRIGIKHVYELLEVLYSDTHDERYKICPLLKKEFLKC